MRQKYLPSLLHSVAFFAGVAFIAWVYEYAGLNHYGPFSLHSWRQADGASLARCYYENGMDFFQPAVHHVLGGDNAAVGEFPLLYYLAAIGYHLWGPHDVILRLLVFGCFTAGMWAWSRILWKWTGNSIVALALPWAFYGSPLLAFYGFNFLPNPAALGLTTLGMYGLWKYFEHPDAPKLVFATTFLLLGALLKVSMLTYTLAAMATAVWLFVITPGGKSRYFPDKTVFWNWMVAGGLIIIGAAAWYLWAMNYNRTHHSGLLMTTILPIWNMPKEEILRFAREIYLWYHEIYFPSWMLIAFLVLIPLIGLVHRHFPRPAVIFAVFVLLGAIAFLILFYNQILVHHYYIIDVMPALMVVFSMAWRWLQQRKPTRIHLPLIPIAAIGLALVLLSYGNTHMADYYGNPQYTPGFNRSLMKTEALSRFMAEKALSYDSTLMVTVPDVTPNVNLYYLNTKGWNTRPDEQLGDADLERYALWRATTLAVTDTAWLSRPEMARWLAHPIGIFDDSVYFFDIRPHWK